VVVVTLVLSETVAMFSVETTAQGSNWGEAMVIASFSENGVPSRESPCDRWYEYIYPGDEPVVVPNCGFSGR
jgi:hypothetical protein